MKGIRISLPGHIVVFQYRDVPHEWHVTCLESASFGWGESPDEALLELEKTLEGQFKDVFKLGYELGLGKGREPEWIQAYNDGKHPTDENIIVALAGELEIELRTIRGRLQISFGGIKGRSSLHQPELLLQPA